MTLALTVRTEELREGDMVLALAGFRPARSVKLRPRKRVVEVRFGDLDFELPYGREINVRRREAK